ncbi:hypothetical protein Zm00014a_014855 [Zea mays]|uniref:Centromere protein C 1 n=1 Tax=Zea mays TaxID=4577 RepID=A0A317Y9B0_MAIZE|nr:hypothetical protein Zm00014a_014855 [Zea mays]
MDAIDPLCAISSTVRLLPRTLGPAIGPSPSKAHDALLEAIALARSLKGSEELVKQATMVPKEHEDIQALYHDDGVKGRPPANGSKEQPGRRPALDRKRARKPVPVVDQSKLSNISDPITFFMTLDRLEEAEEEIKRLNGEAEKRTLNFDPVDEPIRQPGLRGRKSVRSFKVIEDVGTQDPIEAPASQTATMTGSQLSQDVMHAVAGKNGQSVSSRSSEAISEKEVTVSLAEKDGRDDLTYILTSIQDLDESEEEEFIRKTLGIKETRKERVSLRNSILGVRSLRSNTEQKGSMKVHPPESHLPQTRQDRISELEKHLFPGGAANAKCTDDESKGSPDIVMGEPSLVHYSSDVLMTDENFTASDVDRETPNLGVRAADPVLDPEPNLPDHAYERQPGGSSLGLYRDTEVGVAKENETCSRSIIFVEEDDVPIDYITIGRSTDETEVSSSHPLEGSSTEELVTKPVRHAAPDGSCFMAQEAVKEGGVLQDLHGAIGIKAYSPGQDGKRSLKVKSFVPEQYSDLVAKSARYQMDEYLVWMRYYPFGYSLRGV